MAVAVTAICIQRNMVAFKRVGMLFAVNANFSLYAVLKHRFASLTLPQVTIAFESAATLDTFGAVAAATHEQVALGTDAGPLDDRNEIRKMKHEKRNKERYRHSIEHVRSRILFRSSLHEMVLSLWRTAGVL